MTTTKPSKLLLLLSGPENIHRFFVLLLALATTVIFGLDSTTTPALASYNPSPMRKPAVARTEPVARPLPSVTEHRLQNRTPALKSNSPEAAGFSKDYRIEKSSDASQGDWIGLIQKKLGADGRSGSRVRVEAGYGQICRTEPGNGEKSFALEQPSCAYLEASFRF